MFKIRELVIFLAYVSMSFEPFPETQLVSNVFVVNNTARVLISVYALYQSLAACSGYTELSAV